MKKFISLIFITCALLVLLSACGNIANNTDVNNIDTDDSSIANTITENNTNKINNYTSDNINDSSTETDSTTDVIDNIIDEKAFSQGINIGTVRYNLDTFKSKYTYTQFRYSADDTGYDAVIRTPNNESITYYSDGSSIIKDRNHRTVYYGDEAITENIGIDHIDILEYAVRMVESNISMLRFKDLTNIYGNQVYQFVIDINGYDNIEKLYAQFDTEYAKETRENFEKTADSNGYNIVTDPANLRFTFIIDDTGLAKGGMYIYFGKESIGLDDVAWDKCDTIWYFDSYWSIEPWEFTEEWYQFDFKSAIETDNIDELVKIGQEICDSANESAQNHYDMLKNSNS